MAGVRILVRLMVSTVSALIPILFLSGSYSPLSSFLPNLPDIFGSQSSLGSGLAQLLGGNSAVTSVVPLGAAGLTGFVVWTFLQKALRQVEVATYSRPNMKGLNPQEILKSMQGSMPWMGQQGAMSVPQSLPADLTKSQFFLLKTCRQGHTKVKELARELSMDKREIEKELLMLQTNGYLTKSNKLTSKALGVLGN